MKHEYIINKLSDYCFSDVGIEKDTANIDKSANNVSGYDDVYNVKVMSGC